MVARVAPDRDEGDEARTRARAIAGALGDATLLARCEASTRDRQHPEHGDHDARVLLTVEVYEERVRHRGHASTTAAALAVSQAGVAGGGGSPTGGGAICQLTKPMATAAT